VRVLLLVNSSASSVTARTRVVIAKALSADHDVAVADTSRRGHAVRLAASAAADGFDVVAVLGGDGTLNEAANGLAGTDTALAPLPGGSTNVFARTIGLPNDAVEAVGVTLDALAAGSTRFLFHVGMGFDAAVVEQVERRGDLKRWVSHPLFVASAVDTYFRHFDRSRPRLASHLPDGRLIDDGYVAVCLNSNPYTYLGSRPLDIAPTATLHRGLVLVTVRSMRLDVLLRLVGASLLRRRGGGRWVHQATDLDRCTVTGHGPLPYQVDGDFLGEAERLELTHVPAALTLVTPPARPASALR
jgi:diacylglycerol kinase family enzyme